MKGRGCVDGRFDIFGVAWVRGADYIPVSTSADILEMCSGVRNAWHWSIEPVSICRDAFDS